MDCGNSPADSRVGERPDPAVTGPKRFRPGPDAADNQDIDQSGDHECCPRLLRHMLDDQKLGDVTDEEGGSIGILRDVNDVRQVPQ